MKLSKKAELKKKNFKKEIRLFLSLLREQLDDD
jgi:hypothetical protein